MSQENYIAKLLEMEEAIIENVEKTDCFTYINFHLPVREAVCPHCGALTRRIHDYRVKWCCTIKVDIGNSKSQYIEKEKQEATKDGSESTKIQHGI